MYNKQPELFLHPFLIALFPALSLFAGNLGEMRLSVINRSLPVSLAIALILFIILRLATKSWRVAAVLTTFYLVLFFSYGHVYNLIRNQSILGFYYGRHRILGTIWMVSAFIISWVIIKHLQLTRSTTTVLNLVAIVLVALPVFQIVDYSIKVGRNVSATNSFNGNPSTLSFTEGDLPDIYYIILDRYARNDIILSEFGYDNSEFIHKLENRGFYVARCSRSNYPATLPSIASTLNMVYFDKLIGDKTWVSNLNIFVPDIRNNTVRRQLEAIGYHSVSLSSYTNLQWPDAEYFFDPERSLNSERFSGKISPFEAMLLRTTFSRIVLDIKTRSIDKLTSVINYPYDSRAQQQLYILDKIPELSYLPTPIFAYIHINLPHPPYVFGPNGERTDIQTVEEGLGRGQIDGDSPGGYVGQVQFVNQRILAAVDRVLANSIHEPIIIIQGDHGFASKDADAILNAYFVPDEIREQLYDSITPVNTFRILFTHRFNGNYPLLPDLSYLPGDEGQALILSNSSPLHCTGR